MKLVSSFFLLIISFIVMAKPCSIKKVGGDLYISHITDCGDSLNYLFRKCMANNLYTFFQISKNSRIVNESFSDNIGPFEIESGGWCGGNHLYIDNKTKTAETRDVKIYADDKALLSDTITKASVIKIEVLNYIFNTLSATIKNNITSFTDTLCTERVIYIVAGNSIHVDVSHFYTNKIPVRITKYYGMQSMFNNEKMILTPNGKYSSWTEISNVDKFIKYDYPKFNLFVEKNGFCYQASYLFNSGLGNHNELKDDDIIFIGNSWDKCYHKLLAYSHRINGDKDEWSGIYTWFTSPIIATEHAFAYWGSLEGRKAIFFSNNKKGNFRIPLTTYKNTKINILEKSHNVKVKQSNNYLTLRCNSPGTVVIFIDN